MHLAVQRGGPVQIGAGLDLDPRAQGGTEEAAGSVRRGIADRDRLVRIAMDDDPRIGGKVQVPKHVAGRQ